MRSSCSEKETPYVTMHSGAKEGKKHFSFLFSLERDVNNVHWMSKDPFSATILLARLPRSRWRRRRRRPKKENTSKARERERGGKRRKEKREGGGEEGVTRTEKSIFSTGQQQKRKWLALPEKLLPLPETSRWEMKWGEEQWKRILNKLKL